MNHQRTESHSRKFWIWVGITILGLIIAAAGFVFKLTEFIKVAQRGDAESFAIVPVVTYFFVTAGFICIFVWNYLRGGFNDVEKPKFDLLKRDEEIDRHDLPSMSTIKRAR